MQVKITLPAIESNRIDYIVAALKSVAGPVPFVGPLVAEAIGALIPHQRLDRIARYVTILEQTLSGLDKELVKARFASPGFLDLFEDSLLQAVRALTAERLQHIATLVKNGLSDEQQEYDQYKHLLALMAELNDAQIIILHSYIFRDCFGEENEFFQQHRNILSAESVLHQDSPQEDVDKTVIYRNYRQHLVRLHLLRPRFKKAKKNELPDFDPETGMIKASGYQLTPLGRLFLRKLDIAAEE